MGTSSHGAGKRHRTFGQKLGALFASWTRRIAGDAGHHAAIIDATVDLVASMAPDGRLLFLNQAGRKALGLAASDDPRERNLFDCFAPWAREVVARAAFPTADRDGTWVGETALLDGTGGEIPMSQVVIAHRDSAGGVTHYSTILHDISARRAMENRLVESRDFYLQLFNHFPALIWRVGLDGKRNYFNRTWLDFAGRSLKDEVGDGWMQTFHPEDREGYVRACQAAFAEQAPFEAEYRLRRHDGEYRNILSRSAPFYGLDGEFAGFIGAGHDITERRRAEESLRLWQRAIESSVNAITITDAGGQRLVYVNPAFERITGYGRAEVEGRNPRFLQGHDTDQPGVEAIRLALRAQREGHAVLRNYRKDGSLFWNQLLVAPVHDEAGRVTHYVGVQNDITESKRYESELEFQASHDALTGLPNRNLLQDRVAQAIAFARRHDKLVAVLYADVDHFKVVNDSLGHAAGDRLLQELARRLAACVREDDTVARQGGDEFVLVLPGLPREEDASMVAHKVAEALGQPFRVDGQEMFVTCSIGVALFPRDGDDAGTLLRNADTALYRAKEVGRNTFQFYAAEMNARALERLTLESSLRHALEREELVLHYQPQVDLHSGAVVGVEALIRWQHPEFGLLSPVKFIGLAEETGLILPIGEWVLRTACAQAKAWADAGFPDLRMSVNLSARQFRQQDLVQQVAAALEDSGLDPRSLELELTESLLIHNVDASIAILSELSAMGVKIAIDDFGTGYSSLSYLKRFPIDRLKVDQSFVRDIAADPEDAAIVTAIITLSRSLRLGVIAEGVETEEQMAFLRSRLCDEMQGFHFSKPLPVAEMNLLLREGRQLAPPRGTEEDFRRTLLLVDDEDNILNALTRVLRRDGYRVLRASSGEDGLGLLATHEVGVIVSDQRMPGMSGVDFLRRAKELYPDTVRIVLSGYTELKAVTEAINEGSVYKFLTKPWEDDQLRAHILEAFQRHELKRENAQLTRQLTEANQELNEAKRQLERRVVEKTIEVKRSRGMLEVSQEVMESLPVAVLGVDQEGMIAAANHLADRVFAAAAAGPLAGVLAAERLPAVLTDSIVRVLQGNGPAHGTWREGGRETEYWCHAMGLASLSRGATLVVAPFKDGEAC